MCSDAHVVVVVAVVVVAVAVGETVVASFVVMWAVSQAKRNEM